MNSVVILIHCYHSHNVSIGLLLPSGSFCHPPRPSALDNVLLDLHNSSYLTQPHYMAGGGEGWEKKRAMGFTSKTATLYVLHFCRLQARSQVFFLRGDAIQQVDGPNEAEGASLFVGVGGGGEGGI